MVRHQNQVLSGGGLQYSYSGGTLASPLAYTTSAVYDNGELYFSANSGVQQMNAGISGSGGIWQQGGSVVILSAANTFTGITDISGGTLQLGVTNALPSASAVIMFNTGLSAAPGALDLHGYSTAMGSLASASHAPPREKAAPPLSGYSSGFDARAVEAVPVASTTASAAERQRITSRPP